MSKLKYLRSGQEMPRDFWNYNLNPIVGYKITDREDMEADAKKYELKRHYSQYDK